MMLRRNTQEIGKQNGRLPTVSFDPAKVTQTVEADLRQSIRALLEIGPADFDRIYRAALESISAGRALHILYQALMTTDGMSRRRAEELSLALNNKATALMKSEEQARLGISYARWISSAASCGNAEQDAAHKAANRKPYRVDKGMFLNGCWTLPGREDGCKCISKSIVVGLDGYNGGIPDGFDK